jgi:hypothetical protein
MDPSGTAWAYRIGADFPTDITILSGAIYPTYEDGTIADMSNGLYQHHLTYLDLSKPVNPIVSCGKPVFSGALPVTLVIAGAADNSGAIYTTVDAKFNSGYYISNTTRLMQIGDLVNYSNETKTIYSVAEVEYLEGKPLGLMNATTELLNINECDSGYAFHAPEGQKVFSMKGKPMTATRDGYLLVTS